MKKRKILAVFAVLAAAVIAVVVGISIYNAPEKRVARQLQTAYKYLQEGNYEQAALAFERIIAVDKKCIEAYAKGLEAYVKGGDADGARNLFERALEQIGELDDKQLSRNMEYVVDIYLSVEEIYGDDPEHMAELLEAGYELTDGDEQIRNLLVDVYLEIAEAGTEAGRYEDSLGIFDRLLELDKENERILGGLAACLNAYIEELMRAERYDEVRALAEKYAGMPGVDFAAVLKRIEELTAPEPAVYTVRFEAGEGSSVAAQNVEEGSRIEMPQDPEREGYVFAGWYADAATTKVWDFTKEVTEDTTIYAKWEKKEGIMADLSSAKVGDIIRFGSYEQDADSSNGKEAIEWYVLDKKDGKLLLLSRYILDVKPYNENFVDVTWETCSLRGWLNKDFYQGAFTEAERAAIRETRLTNEDNPVYGTAGGKDTKDYVFLLSLMEAKRYFGYTEQEKWYWDYSGDERLLAHGTRYAYENDLWLYDINTGTYHYKYGGYEYSPAATGRWWLRSPGIYSDFAAFVDHDGDAALDRFNVDIDPVGVRPALWVAVE